MRSMRRYVVVFLALAFVLLLGLATHAAAQTQAGTGQIVGTVYDSAGALVPKAKVTLSSKATGLIREEIANDEGQYRFILLPIGIYTVTFTHPGFKTYKADVEATVGAAVTVNAKLELGEVSQVVEVTANPLIESTQPNPDALIGVRGIQELPISGRRFHDFITLTPTVQIEPQRSGISFVGQRGINGNVTIDGADYNEPFFGGIRGGERANNAFTVPQESISQFQVVNSGYSVEFGRSTGGVVNATTKSGTNEIHGSAFFFGRNEALARDDPFNRPAVSNLYQEGGSVGGSIKRDKVFYFAAFENQKNDNPRVVAFPRLPSSPAPDGSQTEAFNFYKGLQTPFTQTNDALAGLGRLDFQLGPSHRISARYDYSKNTADNAVSTGNSIIAQTNSSLSNNGTEGDRTNTATGQWTAIFSPRLVMETRGQYSLENRPRLANSLVAGTTNSIGQTGTAFFLPTTLDDYRVQIASNLTWTRGTHAVKFGSEFNFLHLNQFFGSNQFGVFNFGIPDPGTLLRIMTANPSATPPTQNRFDDSRVGYSIQIGNGLVDANQKEIAIFIQDTWRFTPRVTLTAGFRWEGYVNPQPDISNTSFYQKLVPQPGKPFVFPIGLSVDPAFIPSNYRQYMPRLGIAWDPRGDAKTVIRADAGFFYATTPLLLLAGPLNNFRNPPGDLSVSLPFSEANLPAGSPCKPTATSLPTVYCQFLLIGKDLNTFKLDNLPTLTAADLIAIGQKLGVSLPDPFFQAGPTVMANNYESPRSWQWSVGMEREVRRGWSVGADFVYISTVHLERNLDINLPQPVICDGNPGSRPPCLAGTAGVDLSLRPCFGVAGRSSCSQPRPIASLDSVTLRTSSERALYRALTVRSNYRRGRAQFQAFYTFSKNYSTDDNERKASEFFYDNPFNLAPEYGFSSLDARHLFLFNSLVDLPGGFTVSALGRFRSGRPVDPVIGSPANGAESVTRNSLGDRAFQAPGVPFRRNSFRDRSTQNVDLRIAWDALRLLRAANVSLREGMKLTLTADFFNLFNFANVVITGGSSGITGPNREYGLGVGNQTSGSDNGKVIAANARFLRLTDPSFCSSNSGCYDTSNFPGANGAIPPFTVQLGMRFEF